jgi:hypothetical protein
MGGQIGAGIGKRLIMIANAGLSTEIIYSFIIILCSLMIYFGTKELYELSSHDGLKYFRKSFLFFALAYLFRFFILFLMTYLNVGWIFEIDPQSLHFFVGQLGVVTFIYFSSMAIFYLLYSVMHKKWEDSHTRIYFFHSIAILMSIVTITLRSPLFHLAINVILLLIVMFIFHISNKTAHKKRKNNLHVIYTLIMIFWTINVIDILIPNFFHAFQLIIQLASLSIFLTMLYKVLKNTGSN